MAFWNKKTKPDSLPLNKIIAVASGKGGVGKSTVAFHLAHSLSQEGYRVGLLDTDLYGPSQGAFTGTVKSTVEVDSKTQKIIPAMANGMKVLSLSHLMPAQDAPVVWRAPIAMKVLQNLLQGVEWGDLDFLIVDLPPGTGDVQLSVAQTLKISGAVVVTTPQDMALGISLKGMQAFKKLNVPILGLVENMSMFVCESCSHENHIFNSSNHKNMMSSVCKQEGISVLSEIPLDHAMTIALEKGEPVAKTSKAGQAFERLAKNVLGQVIGSESQRGVTADALVEEPLSFTVLESGKLQMLWKNQPELVLSPATIRSQCRCAACIDEVTGEKKLDPASVPADLSIERVYPVGRYALGFQFSDKHTSGIFPFDRLLKMRSALVETGTKPSVQTVILNSAPELKLAIQSVLDQEINPKLASHGGRIEIADVSLNEIWVKMTGGCQGCSASQITLRQGVEQTLKSHFPQIEKIHDVTDHKKGENPYFKESAASNRI
jgi:ATP-binding protein involved in chromosome partitioning